MSEQLELLGAAKNDYTQDAYGRPVHASLFVLAKRITSALNADPKLKEFAVGFDEWHALQAQQAIFNGGIAVALEYPKINFVWRGLPVVWAHP